MAETCKGISIAIVYASIASGTLSDGALLPYGSKVEGARIGLMKRRVVIAIEASANAAIPGPCMPFH
jgi:hypothetical protein